MWSIEGLQRCLGDRTVRPAKWEGMARLWEVVGGNCPTFWSAPWAKVGQKKLGRIKSWAAQG
jgi:hypothetical protein